MVFWQRPKRQKVAKLEVEGPGFSPDTVLTEDTLTVGKNSYPTSQIRSIRAFTKPSPVVAAVYRVEVGDQAVNISFGQKDHAAGMAIVDAIARIASRNSKGTLLGQEAAGPRDAAAADDVAGDPLGGAKGMYDWCQRRGLASVMDKDNGVRHFGVIERTLLPGEHVLGTFAGLQNYESPARSDGVFAFAATDQRLIASQQKVFGLEPWSVEWRQVGNVELTEGRGHSVITVVGEWGATSVGVEPPAGAAVLELLREAWRGQDATKAQVDVGGEELVAPTAKVAAAEPSVTRERPAMDPYEEVKKAKELLDLGILTQEEFDRKKRELLGL